MTQAPGTTTRTGTRPTRIRWKIFLLLLAIVTINYVDRGSISVALPLIKEEFGLSDELTGVLLAAFFWTYALMQLPSGWLIDRFGARKMVGSSCIAWGAATALTATAPGPGALLGLRALLGATEAPVMPAGGKLNAIWMPLRERGRGAVLLDAGAPLGAGVGGVAISWLIAMTGGWRPAFVVAGVVTVLMGLLAWWYVRDTPRQHPHVGEAEATDIETSHAAEDSAAGRPGGRRGLRRYLKFRSFWAMCAAWLGFNGVFYGLLTWGPLYLAETKGFDIATIGWSTFVIFGTGFVGELVGGWLADAWRARGRGANVVMRTLLGLAGVAVVLGLLGVTVVPGPIAAVVLLSAVLFFLRWVGLMWSVPALLGGREDAGALGGAMNLSGNIAGILTPMLVGFIVGATDSYTWALLYFVGAGLLMTVAVLSLDYTKRLPA
ncbi:MFS transporter [Saccharopolyspora sp. 5N708]|uniref:MFS transporter n=1 Tax=Saccharopolyspora sp. 5N708 TaxID=3457424 RepID=UPI003FD60799